MYFNVTLRLIFQNQVTIKGLLFHTYSQTLLERYQQRFYIDIACPAFLCVWFSSWEAPFGIKEQQIHGYLSTEAYESEKDHIPKRRDALINSLPGKTAPTAQKYAMLKTRLYNVTRVVQCIWAHAECERIPSECYDSFNSVFSKVHNISYYCEVNLCNSHIKQLIHNHYNDLKNFRPTIS